MPLRRAWKGAWPLGSRAGWFSAVFCSALLTSASGAFSADAGPGIPGAGAGWNGLYVGVSAGGLGLGDSSRLQVTPSQEVFGLFGPLTADELNSLSTTLGSGTGAFGAAQVGFNHRFGRIVVGAEADFSLTRMRGRSEFSRRLSTDFCAGTPVPICLPAAFRYDVSSTHDLPWVATARARVGYLASERMLVYATGGLAVGGVRTKVAAVVAPAGGLLPDTIVARYSRQQRAARVGAAVGGGVEYAFTDTISIKAEYLYVHLGGRSFTIDPERGIHDVIPLPASTAAGAPVSAGLSPPSVPGASIGVRDDSRFHSLRVGINLHF